MIKNILLVAMGGAAGSTFRYLCQKWVYQFYPSVFPWGTFLVNCAGCLLIGLFVAASGKINFLNGDWRLFLTTGLCGGFTTFSAFAYENVTLLKNGNLAYAMFYILGSVVIGILAVFAGLALGKYL